MEEKGNFLNFCGEGNVKDRANFLMRMVEYRANFRTGPEICSVLYHPHQEICPVLDISFSTKIQEIPLFFLAQVYGNSCSFIRSSVAVTASWTLWNAKDDVVGEACAAVNWQRIDQDIQQISWQCIACAELQKWSTIPSLSFNFVCYQRNLGAGYT